MKRTEKRLAALLSWTLLLCGGASLCAAQQPGEPEKAAASDTATTLKRDEKLYRIGPGDVLDIDVRKQPAYSREGVKVDNNGAIEIHQEDEALVVACKTEKEVSEEIKARYRKYLRNPQVFVKVKEYNSQPVAVIGAVNEPGRFQLQRRVRLLELLTFVKGPSERAGRTVQLIHTSEPVPCLAGEGEAVEAGEETMTVFNLNDTFNSLDRANPFIRPGDIVRLPEADQVYVIGNVVSPKPLALKGQTTLSQAIAEAGGLAQDADGDKIRIRRTLPGVAGATEIVASLKQINKRKAEDPLLQPNDIIDVPGPSGGKKILNGIRQTLLPSLTRLPVPIR